MQTLQLELSLEGCSSQVGPQLASAQTDLFRTQDTLAATRAQLAVAQLLQSPDSSSSPRAREGCRGAALSPWGGARAGTGTVKEQKDLAGDHYFWWIA